MSCHQAQQSWGKERQLRRLQISWNIKENISRATFFLHCPLSCFVLSCFFTSLPDPRSVVYDTHESGFAPFVLLFDAVGIW
jgi:hypothetical protein